MEETRFVSRWAPNFEQKYNQAMATKRAPLTELPLHYHNVQRSLSAPQGPGPRAKVLDSDPNSRGPFKSGPFPAFELFNENSQPAEKTRPFIQQQRPSAQSIGVKVVPMALHLTLISSQRRAMDQLAKENAFLKWRLVMSHHRPTKHTLPAAEKAEPHKWATPKKRRIDPSETQGVDHLTSAYKHPDTPVSSKKSVPLSCPPSALHGAKMMFPQDDSTDAAHEAEAKTPTKGSLAERLARLEREMHQPPPPSMATRQVPASVFPVEPAGVPTMPGRHPLTTSSASGPASASASTFTPNRPLHRLETAELGTQTDPVSIPAIPVFASAATTDPTIDPVADHSAATAANPVHEWRGGFHYWMLKKMYTQTIQNDGAVWSDMMATPSTPHGSGRRDAMVDHLSTAMAALGEQGRGLESPVPLSALPLVRSKLTDWRTKYTSP